jgi:hypothetical protein
MRRAFALASLVLLAACGVRAERAQPAREVDPAVAAALAAPLLSDPDLVTLDRSRAALSDPGPLDGSLPPEDYAPATVAAARAEAAALVGKTAAPALAKGSPCEECGRETLAGRARGIAPGCRGETDLVWSLRLPADLPVYPKAHLRDALGSDAAACPLRAASFTAPVPPSEVLGFYRAIAARAGFALRSAGPAALIGRRPDGARLAVIVRQAGDDLAQFDLVFAGG